VNHEPVPASIGREKTGTAADGVVHKAARGAATVGENRDRCRRGGIEREVEMEFQNFGADGKGSYGFRSTNSTEQKDTQSAAEALQGNNKTEATNMKKTTKPEIFSTEGRQARYLARTESDGSLDTMNTTGVETADFILNTDAEKSLLVSKRWANVMDMFSSPMRAFLDPHVWDTQRVERKGGGNARTIAKFKW
jgi:hypothetical protein